MTETPYFVIYDGMNSIYQFEDLSNKMNSFPFKIKPIYCTDNPNDLKKTYDELGYLPLLHVILMIFKAMKNGFSLQVHGI